MVRKSAYRKVSVFDVMNNRRAVRGSSHEYVIVVLEAKNGGIVMHVEADGSRHVTLLQTISYRNAMNKLAVLFIHDAAFLEDIWRTNDEITSQGVLIPDSDSLVTRACDNLVSAAVSIGPKPCRHETYSSNCTQYMLSKWPVK